MWNPISARVWLAFAVAGELAYIAGRTIIQPLFDDAVLAELAITAWRVPFILFYGWVFAAVFAAGPTEKRNPPSHPLVWAVVALTLLTGPPAWGQSPVDWSAGVFMLTAPIVALREELFYRAILQRALERALRPELAILATVVLFIVSHVGMQPINAYTISALAALGLVLGVIYQRTRSLWSVVLIHTLYDCIAALPSLPFAASVVVFGNVMAFTGGIVWWSLDREREQFRNRVQSFDHRR